MALKYYTTFLDIYNNQYRVEILDDSYYGPSKEMELGGEAVQLSRTGKKITDPIFSMGVAIQVWCNKNFEYADLFSTPEQTNQIVVGRNGKVIFRGWIEPNLYEEEYMNPPYLISIPAADGLSALENYYPDGVTGRGLINLLSVIKHCLNCTGMNLPINIACGLNPDGQTENRLFENSYVEKESLRTYKDGVYEYDNAEKLLEDILKPFSCRIYQNADEWYIERIKDRLSASTNWIRYATDGTSSIIIKKNSISLDTPQYPFVDNAASLQIDAGYGRQTVKADGEVWDTVIANNFSEGIVYMENTAYPNYPFGADHRIWYRRGTGITTDTYAKAEIKQGVRINHSQTTSLDDRVWQRAQITANNEDEIEISFKLTIEQGNNEAYKGRYKVCLQSKIRQRDDTYLLTLKWEKGNNDSTIYTNGIGADYISEAIYTKGEDWKDGFSKPINISITAKLEHLHDYFDLDELSFAILPVMADAGKGNWVYTRDFIRSTIVGDVQVKVREKKSYDNTFTGTINRKYLRNADDIDIRFWTLPGKYTDRIAANYNYKNGLMYQDYTAIRSIGCPQESRYTSSVPERLLIDNFDQYYDPRDLLSGTVLTSEFVCPDQHITIATRPDKMFLLVGLEASLKDSLYEISLEEIKPHQISVQ